ncbi:retrotransposable element tf2 protein type 2 [Lasius niger]|uniref:Retrotransposable element tf2 protein type 2 n=1 Tax=Lasius niger TaxID=67767 RepID=A0A0J7N9L8_LASNI|nr:retrotransposable element tf2 protein type 2 [Lasius niger]
MERKMKWKLEDIARQERGKGKRLDGKGWERIRERLPVRYKWKAQLAKKKNRKEKACREMLLGIKKDVIIKEEGSKEKKEGKMECIVKIGENRWKVVGVYVNGDMERKLEGLKEWMEEKVVRKDCEKGIRKDRGNKKGWWDDEECRERKSGEKGVEEMEEGGRR